MITHWETFSAAHTCTYINALRNSSALLWRAEKPHAEAVR
jgi:hypothetical protein